MAGNKSSYHGPGLAIETLSVKESSGELQEENAAEVAYLRQLLGVWQACPTCQLNPTTTPSSSSSRSRAAGSKDSISAAHAAVDRILRQQQVLVAQQQRQLLALQVRRLCCFNCLWGLPSTQVRHIMLRCTHHTAGRAVKP